MRVICNRLTCCITVGACFLFIETYRPEISSVAFAQKPSNQQPVDICTAPANEIVAENCKRGNPSTEWDINGAGDPTIQGFGTDISVNRGETIYFKIKTGALAYRIDIYRMGYYGGLGARKIVTVKPSAALPQTQPPCLNDHTTRLYDCGNWDVSSNWNVPADATSGIYFARLVRLDYQSETWRADNSRQEPKIAPSPAPHAYGASGFGRLRNALKEPRASHIYFIVRDDDGKSDILFQTSDPTWVAYNGYNRDNIETNTYGSSIQGVRAGRRYELRAYKVSYNRPFSNRNRDTVNQVFNAEYPMLRWLEANGYDVSYFSGLDSSRRGEEILEHKLFLSVGHDEYWSAEQRTNVEAARDAGVNLAFFSGNEVFWKTRYEPSLDDSKTPNRTLVCYKENHSNAKIDPMKDVWTGTWRTSSPYNPEGPKPENALMGVIFTVNAWRYDPIKVPADYGNLRFWRNTSIEKLAPGEVAILDGANLGHEWDEDLDNGFRPAGLFHLSETTVNNVRYIQDFGRLYDSGTGTHHLTLYRAKSGALVFGAGTVQWSWGLDAHHDNETGAPARRTNRYSIRVGIDPRGTDLRVQQATMNLFADMDAQPAAIQPGLMKAAKSTDKLPPVSKITEPTEASSTGDDVITIAGTASDIDGGVVSGVEITIDGGTRWHPAIGRDNWHYKWKVPAETTKVVIMSRASDDSGNLETPGPGVTVAIKPGKTSQ